MRIQTATSESVGRRRESESSESWLAQGTSSRALSNPWRVRRCRLQLAVRTISDHFNMGRRHRCNLPCRQCWIRTRSLEFLVLTSVCSPSFSRSASSSPSRACDGALHIWMFSCWRPSSHFRFATSGGALLDRVQLDTSSGNGRLDASMTGYSQATGHPRFRSGSGDRIPILARGRFAVERRCGKPPRGLTGWRPSGRRWCIERRGRRGRGSLCRLSGCAAFGAGVEGPNNLQGIGLAGDSSIRPRLPLHHPGLASPSACQVHSLPSTPTPGSGSAWAAPVAWTSCRPAAAWGRPGGRGLRPRFAAVTHRASRGGPW